MALAFPRRVLASVATALAVACLALSSTAAQADQVRAQEWWLRSLHVIQAWRSTHGAGVTVAVLSTGVDAQQADLAGSVVTGPDYTGSGEAPYGPYWGLTGTAVASLIAGHGHGPGGGDGIVGVAPSARILSVRVTLESSDPILAGGANPAVAAGLPDAIARGIRYAVRHQASVIDLPNDPATTPAASTPSTGTATPTPPPGTTAAAAAAPAGGSSAERAAIAYALAHHVVLVAPAGDNAAAGGTPSYPAAYHGVISVGAFDSSFVKGSFSSRRPYVTLTAPGVNVVVAQPTAASPGVAGEAQAPYATVSSTSAASAIVAGIAALIRAQFPQLTPAQVRSALIQGTLYHHRGGRRDGSGYGTADAARALTAAAQIVEAVPSTGGGGSGALGPPTPPAIHSTAPSLSHVIRNDAGIAGAVFALLLVLIFGFSWLRRRRARRARLAEVRAAAMPIQPLRQPPAGSAGFPGPPADLASLSGGAPMTGGDWAGAARGGFPNGTLGPAVAGQAEAPFGPPVAAAPAGDGGSGRASGGPGGAPGLASPARALGSRVPRTPKVSGRPPWEPASRPDGQVPWALPAPAVPAGETTGMPLPQRQPPQDTGSVWDVIAEEAWPGGPSPGQPGDAEPGSAGGSGGDRPSPRPIYTWNPGASTETFPKLRGDSD